MTQVTIPVELLERALSLLGCMSAHKSQFAERDAVYDALSAAIQSAPAQPDHFPDAGKLIPKGPDCHPVDAGFELWWAEHMPEDVQSIAWKAWKAALQAAPAQVEQKTNYQAMVAEQDMNDRVLAGIEAEACQPAPELVATEGVPTGLGNEPDILEVYTGLNGHRQWVTTGAWLYEGDCIAVLSDHIPGASKMAAQAAQGPKPTNCRNCGGADNVLCDGQCRQAAIQKGQK